LISNNIQMLRTAGVIEMLVYLHDHLEGRRKVDIRVECGLNPTTAIKAHKILLYNGLIRGIIYKNATAYELTEQGLLIAKLLQGIKRKMENIEPTDKIKFEIIGRNFKFNTDIKDE